MRKVRVISVTQIVTGLKNEVCHKLASLHEVHSRETRQEDKKDPRRRRRRRRRDKLRSMLACPSRCQIELALGELTIFLSFGLKSAFARAFYINMSEIKSPILKSSTVSKTTLDPFLYCVFHSDNYPAAKDDSMEAPRRGDGQDFNPIAPYRMYHGDKIPGKSTEV